MSRSLDPCADHNQVMCGICEELSRIKSELETLQYNYELRGKELEKLESSLPDTHWAYWRKRAGEMTSAWNDRGEELTRLRAELAEKDEVLGFYGNSSSFNDQQCCGNGVQCEEGMSCCGEPMTTMELDIGKRAREVLAKYKKEEE